MAGGMPWLQVEAWLCLGPALFLLMGQVQSCTLKWNERATEFVLCPAQYSLILTKARGEINCCKTLEFMLHSPSFPVLYIIFSIFSWIPQPFTTAKGQVYLFHSCSHPIKICFQKCWINSHWVTSFLQVLPSPKEICIVTGWMLQRQFPIWGTYDILGVRGGTGK